MALCPEQGSIGSGAAVEVALDARACETLMQNLNRQGPPAHPRLQTVGYI